MVPKRVPISKITRQRISESAPSAFAFESSGRPGNFGQSASRQTAEGHRKVGDDRCRFGEDVNELGLDRDFHDVVKGYLARLIKACSVTLA